MERFYEVLGFITFMGIIFVTSFAISTILVNYMIKGAKK